MWFRRHRVPHAVASMVDDHAFNAAVPESVPPAVDRPSQDLTIRMFGSLREEQGWSLRRWPATDAGACLTPRAIWRELGQREADLPAFVRVAVNQRFAGPDTLLRAGDEVAFLPPITGG